jgi:hypothetical protein
MPPFALADGAIAVSIPRCPIVQTPHTGTCRAGSGSVATWPNAGVIRSLRRCGAGAAL